MADTVNLWAESGRNIIGDDTGPTLILENQSSGEVLKLQSAGGTGVQLATVSGATTSLFIVSAKQGADIRSGATESNVLIVKHSVVNSPTVAPLVLVASGPSAPAIEFQGNGLIAVATGGSVSAAIRVKSGNSYYWIPVMEKISTT